MEDRSKPDTFLIDYKDPEVPAPVTRAERVTIVSGYVLLAAGFILVPGALDGTPIRQNPRMMLALLLLLAGGAVTAFCFIYNALRRM